MTEKQYICKVCGYEWNTKTSMGSKKPKMCANRKCRSILWNRGLADCRFYVNKRYQQQPIKARYLKNGCFIALGNPRSKGQNYHSIRRDGKSWLLHRWIFYINHGYAPISEVMHICNNTDCINPLHLKAGTREENEAHKIISGRSLKGEKNPMSKLSFRDVSKIKNLLYNCKRGDIIKLAKEYDVSSATISLIKYGKNWNG
jgi:hypothetical protein